MLPFGEDGMLPFGDIIEDLILSGAFKLNVWILSRELSLSFPLSPLP